jgi:hypothetical protein
MYPTQRSPRIMDNRILSTSPSLEKYIYEEIDMAIECYNLPSFFSGSARLGHSSQSSLMVSSRSKRDAEINYLTVNY